MAEADKGKLDALLREVQTGDQALAQMMTELAQENGLASINDNHDVGLTLPEKFEIIVECLHEQQQQEIYNRLTAEGLTCRVLTL